MPEVERTYWFLRDSKTALRPGRLLATCCSRRHRPVQSPAAFTATRLDSAVRAAGNQTAVDRYQRELASFGDTVALDGAPTRVLAPDGNFTPCFLAAHPDGAVVRVSST